MIAPHECPPTGPTAALAARMQGIIPVIETARLRLRAPRIEDFEAYADIACGDRAAGIGGPMTRADAWADFMQVTGTWLLRGHGGWTVEDRETAEVLGFVLIGFEPGDQEPELGFMLTAGAEGRGIAAEAARAARDHGFGPLGLRSMVSYVFRDNARSIALVRRIGGELDIPDDWDALDTLVFRHHPFGEQA
jgi:RimJ/RimL family protein N-acetyltransferase